MKPTWLVEAEVFPNECRRLIAELNRQEVKVVVVKFGKTYEEHIADFEDKAFVVFHGSLQFAAQIRRTNWTPGVYCNLRKFECLYYYPRFGKHLLNAEYAMLPFGELARRKNWLLKNLGHDGSVFVRPSSGAKIFTGKVTTEEIWEKDLNLFGFYDVDPEALVVVAPYVPLKREWRAVVAERKIIAGSQYKVDDGCWGDADLPIPSEVMQYTQGVLDSVEYEPDPLWTIDVCETQSGELKVVEVGSFSCAGLYSCNPEPIIETANRLALKDWEDSL